MPRPDLADIQSWTYQLQDVDPALLAAGTWDMVVVDYSRDGTGETAYTAQDIASMKGDNPDRLVISYLSIGEAETYRDYWDANWQQSPPDWLGEENPDWEGNIKVAYWQDDWQQIIFTYLDQIVAAGFDGIYMDIVDAYQYYEDDRDDSAQDMIDFIAAIAARARAINPDFVLIGQNAEELADHADYLALIDGIGKEDLYYGQDGDGEPNPRADINWSQGWLEVAEAAGVDAFVIEYPTNTAQIIDAMTRADDGGFPFTIGTRALDGASQIGSSGKDKLKGDAQPNLLAGLDGKDKLTGGSGKDTLLGGTGKDKLKGNAGKDSLYGEGGKDKLIGGSENDKLFGGKGDDRYIFAAGDGDDRITDTSGNDRLIIRASMDELSFSQTGDDLLITLNGGEDGSILIQGHMDQAATRIETLITNDLALSLTGSNLDDLLG